MPLVCLVDGVNPRRRKRLQCSSAINHAILLTRHKQTCSKSRGLLTSRVLYRNLYGPLASRQARLRARCNNTQICAAWLGGQGCTCGAGASFTRPWYLQLAGGVHSIYALRHSSLDGHILRFSRSRGSRRGSCRDHGSSISHRDVKLPAAFPAQIPRREHSWTNEPKLGSDSANLTETAGFLNFNTITSCSQNDSKTAATVVGCPYGGPTIALADGRLLCSVDLCQDSSNLKCHPAIGYPVAGSHFLVLREQALEDCSASAAIYDEHMSSFYAPSSVLRDSATRSQPNSNPGMDPATSNHLCYLPTRHLVQDSPADSIKIGQILKLRIPPNNKTTTVEFSKEGRVITWSMFSACDDDDKKLCHPPINVVASGTTGRATTGWETDSDGDIYMTGTGLGTGNIRPESITFVSLSFLARPYSPPPCYLPGHRRALYHLVFHAVSKDGKDSVSAESGCLDWSERWETMLG